jgi:hypothetical protein
MLSHSFATGAALFCLLMSCSAGDMTTSAIKSQLTPAFTEDFNHPDGTNVGTAWTRAAHYGIVHQELLHHRLRFEIPDGHDIPWGSATLDLDNPAILGHGLVVGDYFEVTLRRLSDQGSLGIELFDSDQLRVGSDLTAGRSALKAWNGKTWVPTVVDDHGRSTQFNWNARQTLGVRFDSANGRRATFSYYIDGRYVGSWTIMTANKTLDKIGVYVQSKTPSAAFEFQDLIVYARR